MLFLIISWLSIFVFTQVVPLDLHAGLCDAFLGVPGPKDYSLHSTEYGFHTVLCMLRITISICIV